MKKLLKLFWKLLNLMGLLSLLVSIVASVVLFMNGFNKQKAKGVYHMIKGKEIKEEKIVVQEEPKEVKPVSLSEREEMITRIQANAQSLLTQNQRRSIELAQKERELHQLKEDIEKQMNDFNTLQESLKKQTESDEFKKNLKRFSLMEAKSVAKMLSTLKDETIKKYLTHMKDDFATEVYTALLKEWEVENKGRLSELLLEKKFEKINNQ